MIIIVCIEKVDIPWNSNSLEFETVAISVFNGTDGICDAGRGFLNGFSTADGLSEVYNSKQKHMF